MYQIFIVFGSCLLQIYLPLKDKKSKTIPHGFIEIVNYFKHKSNKLWKLCFVRTLKGKILS